VIRTPPPLDGDRREGLGCAHPGNFLPDLAPPSCCPLLLFGLLAEPSRKSFSVQSEARLLFEAVTTLSFLTCISLSFSLIVESTRGVVSFPRRCPPLSPPQVVFLVSCVEADFVLPPSHGI